MPQSRPRLCPAIRRTTPEKCRGPRWTAVAPDQHAKDLWRAKDLWHAKDSAHVRNLGHLKKLGDTS